MVTTLDKYGRILIPKKMRKKMGIAKNAQLKLVQEENRLIIEPIPEETPLVIENGFLVYTGEMPDDVDDFIQKDREDRMRQVLGVDE